jgi:hypothetical protein
MIQQGVAIMQKSRSFFCKILLLYAIFLSLNACTADQAINHPALGNGTDSDNIITTPTYSNNGSYDDNGVEPAPNNGNQNFGRRQ